MAQAKANLVKAQQDVNRLQPLVKDEAAAKQDLDTVNQIDLKTGTLEIQGTFPNPKRDILPGQFGRIRLRTQEMKNVILVPQRAAQELQSIQSVFTVGPDNKVQTRNIVIGDRVGDNWIVTQG